ncbi:uncharacterized protein LOC125370876 [Ricinus communis]|uniref:uncharacterized protein LOC125370876 n=1 Tax=Ricinus communis TaxID=3988 RepID=UPI00201AEC33|nr:uncharacterized protein LOC125370876 [Ricinus communis]
MTGELGLGVFDGEDLVSNIEFAEKGWQTTVVRRQLPFLKLDVGSKREEGGGDSSKGREEKSEVSGGRKVAAATKKERKRAFACHFLFLVIALFFFFFFFFFFPIFILNPKKSKTKTKKDQ